MAVSSHRLRRLAGVAVLLLLFAILGWWFHAHDTDEAQPEPVEDARDLVVRSHEAW